MTETIAGGENQNTAAADPPKIEEQQKPDQQASPADNTQQSNDQAAKQAQDAEIKAKAEADAKTKADFAAKEKSDLDGLKPPEGSKLESKHVDAVKEYAKSLGMNAAQTKQLLERDAKIISDHEARFQSDLKEKANSWHDATMADPEVGGSNFDRSVADCNRAINRFGSPAFKKAMNESGLGNHPEVVRVFARIGRSMSEDSVINGAVQSKQRNPDRFAALGEAMYKNQG